MAITSGHHFKRISGRKPTHETSLQPSDASLLELLSREIAERFAPFSDPRMRAIPLVLSNPEDGEDAPTTPCHPACAEYADSDYCRESWQLHLAELQSQPETHWHTCHHDKRCAYVPVVFQGRCLAAIKLACPGCMAEDDFERQVAFLDLLVEAFVLSRADWLGRVPHAKATTTEACAPASQSTEHAFEQAPRSPHVLRALQYIEAHICDPKLSVARVACELDINSNYLSQLFADQAGQRMNPYIAARRVDLAKTLLTTTDWQIKRIAHETGYVNHNWFCYVFRTLTGLTPGGYRRTTRSHLGGISTR